MTQDAFAKRILALPVSMHGIFEELAVFCTDVLASDGMEADYATVEDKTAEAFQQAGLGSTGFTHFPPVHIQVVLHGIDTVPAA